MSVKGGDKLSALSARKLNRLDDLIDAHDRSVNNPSQFETQDFARDGIIRVRNTTGLLIDAGGVVGLSRPTILPSENGAAFGASLWFDAVIPTGGEIDEVSGEPTENYFGRFGILLEPLAEGESCTAAAIICGITAAKIYVGTEGQQFADIYPGETYALKSGDAGAAQILWVEPGTGEKFGMVRVGNVFSGIRRARFTEDMTDENPEATADVWDFDPDAGDLDEDDNPLGDYVATETEVRLRSFLRPAGETIADRTRCYFARVGSIDEAIVVNCEPDPEDP